MDEIAVLSNDSITYRNPLPIVVDYDNYYLLYESDQNGNFDIYAIEYLLNGNFGNTTQLTTTPDDESLLEVSYNYGGSYFGTWIANENVYVANIDFNYISFENIEILDTEFAQILFVNLVQFTGKDLKIMNSIFTELRIIQVIGLILKLYIQPGTMLA